ncbi:MAG: hypothetical protein IJN04_00075, partial [Clostridia bacterium]|nr:hypothetical protein [Clostridia bacterium]
MGFLDKMKEVKQKATEIWDEAAENRAKMKAEEEAGSDPAGMAKIANLTSQGGISGETLPKLTDQSYSTVFAIEGTSIFIFNEKTNMTGKVVKKLYVTELDMMEIDEFRFDEKYGDSSYYFELTMKDGTTYRMRFYVRRFDDSDSNDLMRLKELEQWAPMFMVIDWMKRWVKEDATKEWINVFMKESGGEEVF